MIIFVFHFFLATKENDSDTKITKMKEHYQKKIQTMQNEVMKLQAAKKEHDKISKNQSGYQRQISTLQRELSDMRSTKVGHYTYRKLINTEINVQ